MKVNFKVQHNVLSGLKYLQVVSRGPLKQKQQEMIVSIQASLMGLLLIHLRVHTGLAQRRSLSTRRSVGPIDMTCSDPLLIHRTVEPDTAPTGMLGRGHYKAISKFVDDDNETHLQFTWSFDVKKDW
jgi:Rho GDP-dissociation inhibitor